MADRIDTRRSAIMQTVRALTFDVQGTCADFTRPILQMGQGVNRLENLAIDWSTAYSVLAYNSLPGARH